MRERRQAIVFALAWGASLVVLLAAISAMAPHAVSSSTASSVRLVIHGPSWTLTYDASTRNNTVFGLLKEANVTLGFELRWVEYGWPYNDVLVTSINGSTSDQARNLWWQYCVNSVYASQGAASQAIHEGDLVKWLYAPPGGADLCR